jgi:hypothetical protein
MLGGDANTFVMTFVKYNVVIRSSKGLLKDGETQLQIPCKNHVHGCIYKAPRQDTVDSHEKKCRVTSSYLAPAQKPIKCKDSDCTKRFNTQTQMTTHHWKVHQWKRKRCETPGCTNNQVFKSRSAYETHVRCHQDRAAPTWQNRRCPIEGCLHDTVYYKKGGLRGHLENAHSLVRGELKEYLKDTL